MSIKTARKLVLKQPGNLGTTCQVIQWRITLDELGIGCPERRGPFNLEPVGRYENVGEMRQLVGITLVRIRIVAQKWSPLFCSRCRVW